MQQKIPLKSQKQFWLGTLLWALLVLSYFIFVVNWLLPSNLAGFNYTNADGQQIYVPGWRNTFFGEQNSIFIESFSNSTVTLARGISTLFLGWVVTKFSHKYTTVSSLVLLSLGFFAAFAPNFWIYLISRFLMAVGGTTLIVLIQPVISRFFNKNQRPYFSQISPIFYPLAGFFSFVLFVNPEVKYFLTLHYQATMAIAAGTTFIFVILYIVFGKNFDIESSSDAEDSTNLKPQTYLGIIKEPQTWVWIALYSSWLIIYVLPSVSFSYLIQVWNPGNFRKFGDGWRGVFGSLIIGSGLIGFLGGFYNKTNLPRKPFLFGGSLIALICSILLIMTGIIQNANVAYVLSAIGAFGIGLVAIGVQTVMLNVPHEYTSNTPRRIQIFMGYIWGVGYVVYTIFDALFSFLVSNYKSNKIIPDSTEFPVWPVLLLLGCYIAFLVLTLFIKESKPRTKTA